MLRASTDFLNSKCHTVANLHASFRPPVTYHSQESSATPAVPLKQSHSLHSNAQLAGARKREILSRSSRRPTLFSMTTSEKPEQLNLQPSSTPAAPSQSDITPKLERAAFFPDRNALELDLNPSSASGTSTPIPPSKQTSRPPLVAAAADSRSRRSGTVIGRGKFDIPSSPSSSAASDTEETDSTEGNEGDSEREKMPSNNGAHQPTGGSDPSTLRHFPHKVDTSAGRSPMTSRNSSAGGSHFPPGESSESLAGDFRANFLHSRYSSTDSLPHFARSNSNMDSHMRSHFASTKPFPTPGFKSSDPFANADYKSTEEKRLDEDGEKKKHWKRWGPYVSERQWATVREDYSGNGDAWTHFPHDQARSRTYRWGEDGLGGISDNHQRLCFSVALWNEKDPILKERMFGVTGHQGNSCIPKLACGGLIRVDIAGNHGEDVKELYYYLDSTPTHSYMKYLYKYPQREYPYERLVRESGQRSRDVTEFEITDTDAFDDDRYWDVFVEVR